MANKIIPKKSSVAAKVPLATDLEVGEIAFNLADKKIYSKDAGGTVIEMGGGGTAGTAAYTKTTITATGGQTSFSVSYSVGYVDVWLNGAKLSTTEYTATTGSTVVLATAATAGDIFEAIAWSMNPVFPDAVSGPASATDNAIVRFNGTTGKLVQNSGVAVTDTNQVLTSTPATTAQYAIRAKTDAIANDTGFYVDASNNFEMAVRDGAGTHQIAMRSSGESFIRGGDFNVDNGTFFVDAASNRVGIGTTSPGARLDVRVSDATAYAASSASVRVPAGTSSWAINTSATSGSFGGFVFGATTSTAVENIAYIGAVSGTGVFSPDIVIGQRTGSTSYAERLRLDSSGNLGLGVTPSAWGSGGGNIQLGSGKVLAGSGAAYWSGNAYYDGATWRYLTSSAACYYALNESGQHKWYVAPSGTADNAITFTQAMTLDASGNLGVGTISPNVRAHIQNTTAATNTVTPILRIESLSSGTPAAGIGAGIQFMAETSAGNSELGALISAEATDVTPTAEAFDLTFRTQIGGAAATEKLRIASFGGLGLSGANYGIQGDVLQSGGPSAAPSWGGAEYTQAMSGSKTLTNTTAEQAIFPTASDTLTLPVGTYEYELVLYVSNMSGTSGNLSFDILGAGTAVVSSSLSQAVGFDGAIATAGAAGYSAWATIQSPASIVTATTGTALTVFINGIFRVGTAGTIIPSISLVTATAALVQPNTHMHVRRISDSATYTTFGPWA